MGVSGPGVQTNDSSPGEEPLFSEAYTQLMELARVQFRSQSPNQTLQPTALVHEVYLKMAEGTGAPPKDRDHLLAVAATAMRQVLIDHARGRAAQKRGGGWARMTLSDVSTPGEDWDVLELDEAIERLAGVDERQARIVELRFFGGLSGEQTARVLGVSERTVQLDWQMAKGWLWNELRGEQPG